MSDSSRSFSKPDEDAPLLSTDQQSQEIVHIQAAPIHSNQEPQSQQEHKQQSPENEAYYESYALKHSDQFQQLIFSKQEYVLSEAERRLYFQTPTGHLMHGTKEGETDSLLQERRSYNEFANNLNFQLQDELINERLPQRHRISTLIKRYKRYKICMVILVMLLFLLDYTLCYFIYNYIGTFKPYLAQIFKTHDLSQIIFVIRMLVILDFSFQLIFLYISSIMALVKDETHSYFLLQVGVVVSMITKLLLSYLVIFYLLCFILRIGLLSLTKYMKNLVINILYSLRHRQRPVRQIL